MNCPVVCPRCRQYASALRHVEPFTVTPRLLVGQFVIALCNTAMCRTGKPGTVMEERTPDSYVNSCRSQ